MENAAVATLEPRTTVEPLTNGHDSSEITMPPTETVQQERKKSTYWTFEECCAVAKEAAPLIKAQGLKLPDKDSDGNWQAARSLTNYLLPIFRRAQETALPRDRRKIMLGWAHLTTPASLLVEVQRLLLNVHDGSSKALNGHAEPETATVKESLIVQAAPPPEPLAPTSFAARSDTELMQEFTRRFFEPKAETERKLTELQEYNQLISDELAGLTKKYEDAIARIQALEVHHKNGENTAKEKLPTVMLIGLHKYVFEEVKTRYANAGLPPVNFKLMETGTQPEPFKADYVICQKFASHSWFSQAQKATKDCLFIEGGAETIVKKLQIWFDK